MVQTDISELLHTADALRQSDRLTEAAGVYRKILELEPHNPEALLNAGMLARQAGDFQLAISILGIHASSETSSPTVWHEMGMALHETGRYREAIDCFRNAASLDPEKMESYYNMGIAHIELAEFDLAADCFSRVVGRTPDLLEARHNLCVCLQECGRLEEAEHGYRQLLGQFPGFGEAWYNLASLALLRGDLARGFSLYEWRFFKKEAVRERSFPKPRWDGTAAAGSTILLHAEQGFGDTIQAVRYVPMAASAGGRVILEVPAALAGLLHRVNGVDKVVTQGEALPDFDFHLPLMSLPLVFGTTLETIPSDVPYISPDPVLKEAWSQKLAAGDSLKVGLVWAGRRDHRINRKRSCPLSLFQPLGEIPGATFYSLQVDDGDSREQQSASGIRMTDCAKDFRGFDDTAACIANLDLVITIDTSVAHLAGALGMPVWLMLPFVPDWRWLLARDDSPWYPTMRLFRQEQPGDWTEVIRRIAPELRKLAQDRDRSSARGDAVADGRASFVDGTETGFGKKYVYPDDAEACLRMGADLHARELYLDAVAAYDHALVLAPDFGAACHNRGNSLLELGRYREAIASYRKAVQLIPSFAEGYVTIATALQSLRRPYEAMASCHRALAIDQDCAEAHWNLALALLQVGDYGQGWEEFEWRWKKRGYTTRPKSFDRPVWDGSPLENRTILIHAEQGFGDTIQFARFLTLVAEQGATVLLECPPPLKELMAGVRGVCSVIGSGEPLPPFDLHLPIMSLPRILHVSADSVPNGVPYLQPGLERLADRVEQFADTGRFRVGIVWAGRKKPDPNRTCPLRFLEPLSRIPQVSLYSLQVGDVPVQDVSASADMGLVDLTGDIRDFSDTAALISQMDLVISIDTGVAHLSGAMGKETWVMLPFAADWRWMLDREDSPWYPTMRLFRQGQPGDWPAVVKALEQALRARIEQVGTDLTRPSRDVEKHYSAAFEQLGAGNLTEAEGSVWRALLRNPHIPDIYNTLGVLCREYGNHTAALSYFRHAISLDPAYADGHINFGNSLHGQDRLLEAVDEYRRAIELAPRDIRAHQNLGVALQSLGRLSDAAASFSKALELDPSYFTAGWNLAVLKLLGGRFAEGFNELETRFLKKGAVPALHGDKPLWDGSRFRGKTVLVHAEQGFGDTFQFIRYLPMVAARGGTVLFECQDGSLRQLLQCSLDGITVYARGEQLPYFDLQVPLLSLPRVFGTTIASIPVNVPYLAAPKAGREAWKGCLEKDDGLKVGLVWAGRPKPDPKRSASLPLLAPLAGLPGVSYYSLQVGKGSEQALTPPEGMRLRDCSADLTDFTATASLIANLDLVITIDSAVAHLAGGMGKPVWVLLPFAPDWRWMLERCDCPWYPTMCLFRQKRPGDWADVIDRVRHALQTYLVSVRKG